MGDHSKWNMCLALSPSGTAIRCAIIARGTCASGSGLVRRRSQIWLSLSPTGTASSPVHGHWPERQLRHPCTPIVKDPVVNCDRSCSPQLSAPIAIDRSQAGNGRLCRVAVTDLGEFAPVITIRGRGLPGCCSGLTHYAANKG